MLRDPGAFRVGVAAFFFFWSRSADPREIPRDRRPSVRYSVSMAQVLTQIALVVREYEEAIRFYVDVLGFELLEDTDLGDGKRWVRVAPRGSGAAGLLLARATTPAQQSAVGNQSGGRVFLFLETDDFARDHGAYRARGVRFMESPREEVYGTVAVFFDLYGNKIDLIGRRRP